MEKYYLESPDSVLSEFDTKREGLSEEESRARLGKYGPNVLEEGKKTSLVKRFLLQLTDPMIIILLAAAAVSFVIAVVEKESFADAVIILVVVLINALLGVYQENNAEKAIEALQAMSAATSKVVRGGKPGVIPSSEIVPGDIVILEAGDRVPADGRIIEDASLQAEEASLTGESLPVRKVIDALNLAEGKKDIPLGDRKNMAYMGSSIVYGRGVMVVTGTGMNTEMGKIAGVLNTAEEGKTPLQKKLLQLSKILTWLVLAICVIVFVLGLIRSGGLSFPLVLNSFMTAVSLAVAAIPEGLAAVVTVVLSIGVTNMSKRNAIIRRLTAVETLGSAEIICSDKTGTLTQNRMTVVDYFGDDEKASAVMMSLCSDAESDEEGQVTGEPTEAALVTWAYKLGENKYRFKKEYRRTAELPFDSQRKMMSTFHVWGKGYRQITKGAPDVVTDLCTAFLEDGVKKPMTEAYRSKILSENKAMADKALRVLALAVRDYEALPGDISSGNCEKELCFVGLSGMIDPVRPEVVEAIRRCKDAGIRPVMITGDHIDTASAIARELGILRDGDRAVTGSELDEMEDESFEREFTEISVYARVQPEHKARIVRAWQDRGKVTAMTGDGVNDAPSIKMADIGVGMGITGTDVTKNVADMVLSDDNFASIVNAVEEGRRIYDNIRKAIQFLLGSNMAEVLAVFVSTILGFTILKPVHLLWINLITDTFPALALGMEKAEGDVMKKKPRPSSDGIFAGGMGFDIAYQGVLVAGLVILSYFIGTALEFGAPGIRESAHGMTMAFLTMTMAEVFHAFNMRSLRKSVFTLRSVNWVLFFSALGSLVLSTIIIELPALSGLFGFTNVGFTEYIIALGLGAAVIPVVELVKLLERKYIKK